MANSPVKSGTTAHDRILLSLGKAGNQRKQACSDEVLAQATVFQWHYKFTSEEKTQSSFLMVAALL